MAIIGSARHDENGKLVGGKAGDQTQITMPDFKGEVSQQNFYVHSKGWYILRAKDYNTALRISRSMILACNNPNIGYSQSDRLGIIKNGTASQKPTNCDCSSLVRQCVKEATGIDAGNFNTSTEVSALMKTGLFELIEYMKGMTICTGDILVTKTKGHTAISTNGEPREEKPVTVVTRPTLRVGSKGEDVKYLHRVLKKLKYGVNVNSDYFDSTTKACVMNFQASRAGLEVDGIVGKNTWREIEKIGD